ncbi:MAG TPA: glycosyltransferase family 2 protein [Desulfobacterales bacterium]|nr:glycosyltransferase family 2 protein [Desulfobacterales bacterium]
MQNKKISVIIPAYNEAENIGDVISEIRLLHPDFEIIVIDDGSDDNTSEVATQAGAIVYQHPYNIGNGAAIKSGMRVASGDILIFMDGDGQHDPNDVARLLEHFPEYDMVVGARRLSGHTSMTRAFGNKIYNWLGTYVTNFPIKDLTSGFRAIKTEIANNFRYLLPNTYSYPTTLTLGLLRSGRSVKYIPIMARMRKKGTSDIKLVRDGARFFMIIIRICTHYSPMRIFLPVSLCMFALGLIRYIHSFLTEGRFTNMSALLFVTSVIIFMMSLISEQISQMRFERRGHRSPLQQTDGGSGNEKPQAPIT